MNVSLAELQYSILALPQKDYFSLLRWFHDRELEDCPEDLDADAEWARHESQRTIAEDATHRGVLLDISFEAHGCPAWAISARRVAEGGVSEAKESLPYPMTAGQIVAQAKALPKVEFYALLHWFLSYDNDLWDWEMEQDAAAGRLDLLLKDSEGDERV